MILPEDLEQVGKADLVGMEDDSDHLRVSRPACNIQHLRVLACPTDGRPLPAGWGGKRVAAAELVILDFFSSASESDYFCFQLQF